MILNLKSSALSGGGRRRQDAIALVITLLMLSVITFLAVAFLAVTQRNRAASTASIDASASRVMSDAAIARAQTEIIARMMAQTDYLAYDYMVSRNYINPYGFIPGITDTTNVNYDFTANGALTSSTRANWAQNIANLFYDPRPPVFVATNPLYPNNTDFRFWVDINRNGRFETNGNIPTVTNEAGQWGVSNIWAGEPEWIGVLNDPLSRHSRSNMFIGRFAYMVLPIGKTLDLNYIHNAARWNLNNRLFLITNNTRLGFENDGFARDQGTGSWELNLAAMLDVLCPDAYEYGFPNSQNPPSYRYAKYDYSPALNTANTGSAFGDAEAILHYRYWPFGNSLNYPTLRSLTQNFPATLGLASNIDSYCLGASTAYPFVAQSQDSNWMTTAPSRPWPGSYTTNMFYDPEDLFDTNKTSPNFVYRLMAAGAQTNTFDRYTFERLLQCIGTGSAPEYGVYVYANSTNPAPGLQSNLMLRTKVNINYDNTAQILSPLAPYAPMTNKLNSWTPLGFFTNAADLLLRSQEFLIATNITSNHVSSLGWVYTTNYGWVHFGITNIPIYNYTNSSVRYSAQIHRMLQLAANIYDATMAANLTNHETFSSPSSPTVYYPHVYRPLFSATYLPGTKTLWTVTIVGYTNVSSTPGSSGYWATQVDQGFKMFTPFGYQAPPQAQIQANNNIWGVPWVVGTVKGLPSFSQFAFVNSLTMTRRLLFTRPSTNVPPTAMSQSYGMTVSNLFGAQLWNPYTNTFPTTVRYAISNFATISITNTNGPAFWYTNILVTNVLWESKIAGRTWTGYPGSGTTGGIKLLFVTNAITLPESAYYSEHFGYFTNSGQPFLPQDYYQGSWSNGAAWPIHSWVLNVTNYVMYYLYEQQTNRLLDFVNLGPFGTSLPLLQVLSNGVSGGGNNMLVGGVGNGSNSSTLVWNTQGATDRGGLSAGVMAQINIGRGYQQASDWPNNVWTPPGQLLYWQEQIAKFNNVLNGGGQGLSVHDPFTPTAPLVQWSSWQANDPLVHYTLEDLTWASQTNSIVYVQPVSPTAYRSLASWVPSLGQVNSRYDPWPGSSSATKGNMVFKDPGQTNANAFDFPTNKFPGIGWLGRIHRGTPWQTVYFKYYVPPPPPGNDINTWYNWAGGNNPAVAWGSFPTNDWALPDLFTAVPNDNAARGLLSVNQINDPAWAAVFAGLVVPTNQYVGTVVEPEDVYGLVDGPDGINATREKEPNGLFHRLGYLLKTPALTFPYPFTNGPSASPYSDEVVERIPQQILSLVKLGEPQFVIYAWGQSLRPSAFYAQSGPNNNICTNYEITGEVLTRTACHVVTDPQALSPKIVIDSFNIEPGY